jgi:hypothetical protein
MPTRRRERFLRLERPRDGAGGRPDPLPNDERFEQLGGEAAGGAPPRPPAATPVPSRATDRFRPPPERAPDTAGLPEGAQPFTRCARCEVDSSVYARACQNCGADLETPEQRSFNEQLWARRRAEAEVERKELAEREQERRRLAGDEARLRREVAEEMARRERDRVDGELGGWGRGRGWGQDDGDWGRPQAPVGLRLLRLLPGLGWRIAAVSVAFAVPLLLILLGRGTPQLLGMMLMMLFVGLFSSGRRWRRW